MVTEQNKTPMSKNQSKKKHQTRKRKAPTIPNKLRDRGGVFGRAFLNFVGKYLGGWAILPFAPFIIPYFLIVLREVRKSLMVYWRALRPGKSTLTYLFYISKQYLKFAFSLLERAGHHKRNRKKFLGENNENIKETNLINEELKRGSGVMVICSHIGGYNLYSFISDYVVDSPLNIFTYDENVKYSLSDKINKDNVKFINPLKSDFAILKASKALRDKEVLTIMGDRVNEKTQRYKRVTIKGMEMNLPLGPWYIAKSSETSVICLFIVKDRESKGYKTILKGPVLLDDNGRNLSKRDIIDDAVSRYASYIEEIITKYPFQWYNFSCKLKSENENN